MSRGESGDQVARSFSNWAGMPGMRSPELTAIVPSAFAVELFGLFSTNPVSKVARVKL